MKKENKVRTVSFRVTEDELFQLDKVAEFKGLPRSWVLRGFIEKSFKKIFGRQPSETENFQL